MAINWSHFDPCWFLIGRKTYQQDRGRVTRLSNTGKHHYFICSSYPSVTSISHGRESPHSRCQGIFLNKERKNPSAQQHREGPVIWNRLKFYLLDLPLRINGSPGIASKHLIKEIHGHESYNSFCLEITRLISLGRWMITRQRERYSFKRLSVTCLPSANYTVIGLYHACT